MSPQPPDTTSALPEALRQQLEGFRRDLWRTKILEATAAGVIGLLISYLLVFALDRFFPTPGWVRLLILVAGVSIFAGFVPYWLHRWVWRQRRDEQLARLIARRYPGLGDRLLGVIELENQQGSADSLSPRLRQAAMLAVADEVAKRPLQQALPPQRHRMWAGVTCALAAVAIAAVTVTPQAGLNALVRWLLPLSKTERYTFTRLDQPPLEWTVATGESFTLTLTLSPRSEQRPPRAIGRIGVQAPVSADLSNNHYHFNFPGQQTPSRLVFRIGDLVHSVRVVPLPRPGLESLSATLTPPSYLKQSERTLDLRSGVLSVVEGSQIRLEMTSDRRLATANFGPTRLQSQENATAFSPVSGSLSVSGVQAKSPPIEIGNQPFELPLTWTDRHGLKGDAGFNLQVNAAADAAPSCYLQGIDRQKVMLPEETIDFELLAEDDFGIKMTGLEWSGQATRPNDDPPAHGELKLQGNAPDDARLVQSASFSPAAFSISPQRITLRGFTEDYAPNRGRSYSEPVTLYILSRDEHAQMLKTKFDRIITELEDLARRESDLLDENQRIERLDGTELQNDANSKRLEDQEQAEAETQRRLDELTDRMENLMKDATRNGEIDKATLKKIAESLKPMQELTQQDIPDIGKKLDQAQAPSNTPDQAKTDVTKAVEAQKQAVQKMQDAIANATEANRKFEAGTFVNRLKNASSEQNAIATTLINSYPKILGLRASKLDPSEQRRLKESASQQANTGSDIRWLQDDLANYFARTKTDTFKQLLDEMKASEIDVGLDEIGKLLRLNHSFLATESAKKWADQLAAWAAKLAGDNDRSGGGGGGGSQNPEDEDFEFMLRVMKLIQQEQDIRSQTRVLEQVRRSSSADPVTNP